MTDALDSIGLYVIDCNMSIQSSRQYTSLDDLRSDVINSKASVVFDVDCFIGKSAWRSDSDIVIPEPPPMNNFINEMINIEIGDIASYIMKKKEELNQDETLDG